MNSKLFKNNAAFQTVHGATIWIETKDKENRNKMISNRKRQKREETKWGRAAELSRAWWLITGKKIYHVSVGNQSELVIIWIYFFPNRGQQGPTHMTANRTNQFWGAVTFLFLTGEGKWGVHCLSDMISLLLRCPPITICMNAECWVFSLSFHFNTIFNLRINQVVDVLNVRTGKTGLT